jgi:hypothetical protein
LVRLWLGGSFNGESEEEDSDGVGDDDREDGKDGDGREDGEHDDDRVDDKDDSDGDCIDDDDVDLSTLPTEAGPRMGPPGLHWRFPHRKSGGQSWQ